MIRPRPHPNIARFLTLVGLGVGAACGRVETDEPAEHPSPENHEEDPPGAPEEEPPRPPECNPGDQTPIASPLEVPASIPPDPREEVAYPTGVFSGASGPIEIAVPFDLGSEASRTLRLKLGSVFDLECGTFEGSFSIESMQVLSGSAQVMQAEEPDIVTVRAEEAGNSVVEVHGVLQAENAGACSDEPAEVPLVYSLLIQAEEFEWSVETQSTCPPSIASGRPLPVKVVARDAAGEVRYPMNLTTPALSISTSEGLELRPFDAASVFYSNFVPSVTAVGAGTVTVALTGGSSSLDVRVLAAEELDDVYLEYALSGILSRGDLSLEPDESYGFYGQEPKLDVYARFPAAQGQWICGAPDANDFWITSLTPAVCPVEERVCQPQEGNVRGNLLYDRVPIVANGTCTLRIDAPSFADGAGVSYEVSFDLEDSSLAED